MIQNMRSRRQVIAGLATSLVSATACHGQTTTSFARRPTRSLSSLGIDRFATRDQQTVIQRAFDAAHEGGFDLVADPDANYHHDGPLTLAGVSFDGRGCTFTPMSDGPQAFRGSGRDFRIANLRLLGSATTRLPDDWHNGLWIGEEGRPAQNFTIENVTVDSVGPGRGVATAGFMFSNAFNGRIIRPVVRHSLADGIHCTYGSSNLLFDHPLSESTGDDGFAVVSYRRHGRISRNIRVINGISRDSAARGFSVVGGLDITYERPVAERASAAGIYLFGESSYDTYGVARARVIAPVVRGCVTGRQLPPDFNQGAITIGGREGEDQIDGERVARGAVDCVISDAVIEGAGARCWAGVLIEEHAVRPRISRATMSNIVPPTGSTLQSFGLHLGGRDMVIDRPRLTRIGGIAVVVTRTASGQCIVTAPQVNGSSVKGGPVDSVIYAENAPHLTRLIVRDGVFSNGPRRAAVVVLPESKVQLSNNQLR